MSGHNKNSELILCPDIILIYEIINMSSQHNFNFNFNFNSNYYYIKI